jgi:hypothetical protein
VLLQQAGRRRGLVEGRVLERRPAVSIPGVDLPAMGDQQLRDRRLVGVRRTWRIFAAALPWSRLTRVSALGGSAPLGEPKARRLSAR